MALSTEERSRIFRKLFRTQRYAKLQDRLQEEASRLNQQRLAQNTQLDSLLAGLQVAPDDPDADALDALCAQTEPATALTLLEGLLQRQQAAQEAAAASLADTEARLDAIQQQLGAARQAAQLARQLAEQQAALDAARPALDAAKAESARHADDAARLDALTGQVTQARTALTAYDELDALCREQKQAQDAAQLAGALAAKRRTQLEALDASLAAADTALAVLVDAPTRQLALQNQAAQLEARIRSLTRRKFIQEDVCLRCSRITFDTRTREASVDGTPLALTRKESALLEYFLLHRNRIISPEEMIEHLWDGSVNSFSNSIRVHISSLRKKLQGCPWLYA